jgi:two-component system, LuxR family, sensor histidine kinase DctS
MEDSLVTGLRARDMSGCIRYVNPAFCGMTGFEAHELLGQKAPMPYWPPELIDEYRQRQAIRLSGNQLTREGYESVFMRKDGSRFSVLVFEAPLIDAQGRQTGWMSAGWKSSRAPRKNVCKPVRAWPPWGRWHRCSATS